MASHTKAAPLTRQWSAPPGQVRNRTTRIAELDFASLMSDLTNLEKRHLERLFGMNSGYVLTFSNRTFDDFVFDSVGKSIVDRQAIRDFRRQPLLLRQDGRCGLVHRF